MLHEFFSVEHSIVASIMRAAVAAFRAWNILNEPTEEGYRERLWRIVLSLIGPYLGTAVGCQIGSLLPSAYGATIGSALRGELGGQEMVEAIIRYMRDWFV